MPIQRKPKGGTPSTDSVCAAVVLALLFTACARAESEPPRVDRVTAEDEAAPAFDGRPDADRLPDVLAGLVGEPLQEATGLGDVELADLLEDLDEEAAAALIVAALVIAHDVDAENDLLDDLDEEAAAAMIALALAVALDADDEWTHNAYCVSHTDDYGRKRRQIYPTGVFGVDVTSWRNVKDDRPSTATEVMNHFEIEYAEWLKPRYEGVYVHKTHCRPFDSLLSATAALAQDAEDFRELGHRVVETDWTP